LVTLRNGTSCTGKQSKRSSGRIAIATKSPNYCIIINSTRARQHNVVTDKEMMAVVFTLRLVKVLLMF
jgi:hypothetical protein